MNGQSLRHAACPNEASLQAFSSGDVSEEEAASILAHLDVCERCQSAVEHFAGDDMLRRLSMLSDPALSELLEEPALRETENKLLHTLLAPGGEKPDAAHDREQQGQYIGRYRIVREIATGGMGEVYEAVHTTLGKRVALKLLPPQRAGNFEAVERFRREMKAVGRFSHPNVVTATDAGEDQGRLYLAMEYVEGVDLSAVVRRLGPLDVADACELIRQAARGVQAIHEQGLVHRDLKPSNLMLTREGTVKVLDFGLSRFLTLDDDENLTETGQLLGTRRYMAPEQFESARVDSRSDLYSLGASLWTLVTGENPPSALLAGSADEGTRKTATSSASHPALAEHDKLPGPLSAVLRRVMAFDPNERLASAGELVSALEPLCEGSDLVALAERALHAEKLPTVISPRPVESDSPPGAQRIGRQVGRLTRRSRVIITVAIAALLAAVGAVAAMQWLSNAKSDSSDPPQKPGNPQVFSGRQRLSRRPSQRSVAEWILSLGGRVKPHGHPEVDDASELPEGTLLVQGVNFYDMKEIGDEELEPLSALAHLQLLNLSRTSVTDRAAGALRRLRSLQHVYLNYTAIGDDTLEALASLPNLATLSLKKTKVTDRNVDRLAGLSHLIYLDLSGTQITDKGLAKLAGLPALRSLLLSETAVTGEGLRGFRRLADLKTLDLSGTKFSDAQIPILEGAVSLQRLVLTDTQVTAEGVSRLRQALPACEIEP